MTNLDYAIHDAKFKEGAPTHLNDYQIRDILDLVGKGCRQSTKEKLERRLNMPLSLFQSYGIYNRMKLTPIGADYVPCQSWTEEMRTLRECILG